MSNYWSFSHLSVHFLSPSSMWTKCEKLCKDTNLRKHFESGTWVSGCSDHDFWVFNSSPLILIVHVWADACVCVCMTNTNLNKIIHKTVKWNVKVQSHFERIRKHQPSAPVSSYSNSFCSCSASLRTSVGRTRFSAETQDLLINHLSP